MDESRYLGFRNKLKRHFESKRAVQTNEGKNTVGHEKWKNYRQVYPFE